MPASQGDLRGGKLAVEKIYPPVLLFGHANFGGAGLAIAFAYSAATSSICGVLCGAFNQNSLSIMSRNLRSIEQKVNACSLLRVV
jgi:hypothetical protein